MLIPNPKLPSLTDWGWLQTMEGGWEVKWTALSEVSHACCELLECGCSTNVLKLLYSALLSVSEETYVTVDDADYDPA